MSAPEAAVRAAAAARRGRDGGVNGGALGGFNAPEQREFVELQIGISEMVLLDERVNMPVCALFAGRSAFVVLARRTRRAIGGGAVADARWTLSLIHI